MSGHDDHHGSSPAAWTTVGLLCLASLIVGVGFVAQNWAVVIVGSALFLVGLLVGKGMQARGLGVAKPAPRPPVTLD
jgi:hypothetical protein